MAGVKGRSGGARPGAGRPAAKLGEATTGKTYDGPEDFLLDVMNDGGADTRLRLEAAKALLARGKKQGQRDQAGKAASGKFTATKAPGKILPLRR